MTRITVLLLDPQVGDPRDVLGFIPTFLHETDERSAREQFNDRYISGWSPFAGFSLDQTTMKLSYPGDPPMMPRLMFEFRDELVFVYPYSWVLIMQQDGTWEISRMD